MLSILLATALMQGNPSTAWGNCLGTQVGTRAAGGGSADAIADQAMQACRGLERRVRTSVGGGPAAERMVREMRERMRQLAISTRAQLRGAASTRRPSGPGRAAQRPPARQSRPVQGAAVARRAFDLVNHHNSPVVRFQANTGTGWSRNWLATQVAPDGQRNLRFASATRCTVSVRIVFADQRMVEDDVNFCGASFLNTNGRAIWAE